MKIITNKLLGCKRSGHPLGRFVAAVFLVAGCLVATGNSDDGSIVVGWDLTDQPLTAVDSLAPTTVAAGAVGLDL